MAHPAGESSNSEEDALFEELADWNHQLEHLEFDWDADEIQVDVPEEPQP